MTMDAVPVLAVFGGTILIVLLAIEVGYRMGCQARRRSRDEKESPVSAMAGSILGLLAFMLAFTFGIVADRYDARKELVREEANAIGTAYLRSTFLPEADRSAAAALFKDYVDQRLIAVRSREADRMRKAMAEADRIQQALWTMAVAHARTDMNSDVAALYVEALNAVIDIHALRVAIVWQVRIPLAIWLVLYALILLGMLAIGYQTGIADSKRSFSMPLLAIAFSLVIALISALDHAESGIIPVSQKPLEDLQSSM